MPTNNSIGSQEKLVTVNKKGPIGPRGYLVAGGRFELPTFGL